MHTYSSAHFFPERFLVFGAIGLVYPLQLCLGPAAQDLDELFVVGAQAATSLLHNACGQDSYLSVVARLYREVL